MNDFHFSSSLDWNPFHYVVFRQENISYDLSSSSSLLSLPVSACTIVSDHSCNQVRAIRCDDVPPSPKCEVHLTRTFPEPGTYCVNISLVDSSSLTRTTTVVTINKSSQGAPGELLLLLQDMPTCRRSPMPISLTSSLPPFDLQHPGAPAQQPWSSAPPPCWEPSLPLWPTWSAGERLLETAAGRDIYLFYFSKNIFHIYLAHCVVLVHSHN